MSYLADENGRWRRRWIEIHKLPVPERIGISLAERRATIDMDTAVAHKLKNFFEESADGMIARELFEKVREGIGDFGNSYSWTVRYDASFIKLAKSVFEIKIAAGNQSIDYRVISSDWEPACPDCSGRGSAGPATFLHMPTAEEVRQAVLRTPGYVATQKRDEMVPARVQEGELRLAGLLDEFRGAGLFDEAVRLMDDTIFGLSAKHIVDHHLWISSRHSQGTAIAAMTLLGELTPRALYSADREGDKIDLSSVSEAPGAEKEEWASNPRTYMAACPRCHGMGFLSIP